MHDLASYIDCEVNLHISYENNFFLVLINSSRMLSLSDIINAQAFTAGDPIANRFPVTAVVFSNESSTFILCLTSGGRPISLAFPPALSAMGPEASVVNVIPSIDTIATAASPMR
jgi:hypothetical protein